LSGLESLLLAGTVFLTAILSAVVGMAGGLTLLVVMLQWIDPLIAIPLHGVVQLVSNGTRVGVQRRHVDWRVAAWFALLLLPAGWIGLSLAEVAPRSLLRAAIGVVALSVIWLPKLKPAAARAEVATAGGPPRLRFLFLGGAAGALNTSVGAAGPFIAPFFLDLGLDRRGVIGTKAACQTMGHLIKILIFGLAGFVFWPYLPALGLMACAAVLGTWTGSWLLDRVSEAWFKRLYVGVLSLLGLRLVLGGLF
jgi:uncharacterized protein